MRLSGSATPRVELCAASAVLPQVDHVTEAADAGSAAHEHLRDRARFGVDEAVRRLDGVIARWGISEREASFLRARLMRFEWTPPAGNMSELRLALMPDWSVKLVPAELRFISDVIMTAQFDIAWAEPGQLIAPTEPGEPPTVPAGSALWVVDAKFGDDRYVTTIENNMQVATYSVLAARWVKWQGEPRVVPAVLFPGPGQGEWDVPEHAWGPREIDAAEKRLADMLARVDLAQRQLEAGQPLQLTEGRHCEYCPAQSRCPAKHAMIKGALDQPAPFGDSPLSLEEAAQLAAALPQLDTFVRRGREALKVFVDANGPIPLGDGVVWGPEIVKKTTINAAPAKSVLDQELADHAADAMKVDISRASIERAVKALHAEQGITRQVAPTMRRIMAKLGEAGALTSEEAEQWCAHRPDAKAPALDPTGT